MLLYLNKHPIHGVSINNIKSNIMVYDWDNRITKLTGFYILEKVTNKKAHELKMLIE